MSQTAAVVDALKRALKARDLTYAQVAKTLKLSEASVKRMFAANHFTLERFEQVCQLAGIGLTDLAREVDSERNYISQLTLEQEREIVGNPKLFLVAVSALNHMTLEQVTEIYDIPKSECIQLLLRLDHIKFLELLPKNRIKLLVTRTFSWLPNGPILQYFRTRAVPEYFRSPRRTGGVHDGDERHAVSCIRRSNDRQAAPARGRVLRTAQRRHKPSAGRTPPGEHCAGAAAVGTGCFPRIAAQAQGRRCRMR
jgi:transcriptional regulator with XRE-family HTH domain